MYCFNCGKEIPDGSAFCTYCGTKQNPDQKPESQTMESISKKIDQAGETFGKGVDEAFSGFRQEFKNAGETVADRAEKLGGKAEEVKGNWQDYITLENMEKLIALCMILPLFFGVIHGVMGALLGLTYGIIYFVFRIVYILVNIIFVLTSVAAVASAIYIVVKNVNKRNAFSYISLGGTCLVLLACLGIVFHWPVVPFICGLLCLIWGADIISRVVLKGYGIETTPNVSEDLKEYKIWYEGYKREHPSGAEAEAQRIASDPAASYFDGDGLTLFGLRLLAGLVCGITCGIATPWMICKVYSWRISHTVVNGRRLVFKGTGGSLFGHFLLWSLLSVITCGIYSFFMYVALKKWELQNTYFEDNMGAVGMFDGNSFEYFGYGLLQSLLLLISCGIAWPWTSTMIMKWETGHSVIGGLRLKYEGTALGILGQYIIIALLSIVTCGIYASWGTVRLNKYIIAHTRVFN